MNKITFEEGCTRYWGLTPEQAARLRQRVAVVTPNRALQEGPVYPEAFFQSAASAGLGADELLKMIGEKT